MGIFGAVFGCRGDAGFIGPLFWACSGVVGFNVAMFLSPARDVCRPTWPDVGASAKKFALRAHNGKKLAFDGALGKYFRGNAAGAAALGEFFRGNAAGGAVLGEFFADRQSWDPTGRVVLRRGPGSLPRQPPVGLTCA